MSYLRDNRKISNKAFCKEKFLLFKEYVGSHSNTELFPLFSKWADTNGIHGIERHEIWRRARKLGSVKTITIIEGSEEDIRLRAVLDILLEADLKCFHKLMERKGFITKEEKHEGSGRNFNI